MKTPKSTTKPHRRTHTWKPYCKEHRPFQTSYGSQREVLCQPHRANIQTFRNTEPRMKPKRAEIHHATTTLWLTMNLQHRRTNYWAKSAHCLPPTARPYWNALPVPVPYWKHTTTIAIRRTWRIRRFKAKADTTTGKLHHTMPGNYAHVVKTRRRDEIDPI